MYNTYDMYTIHIQHMYIYILGCWWRSTHPETSLSLGTTILSNGMFKDFRNCHDLLRSMWFHHTPTSTVGGWAHHFPKNTTGLQMDQRRKHHGPGFSGPSRIFPASMKSAMSCLPNQNERIQRQSPKLGIGGILDYQMSLQGYVCFFFSGLLVCYQTRESLWFASHLKSTNPCFFSSKRTIFLQIIM